MEENKNVLDELNKGAQMGIYAIKYVFDSVEDDEFKKLLENQQREYEKISGEAEKLYANYTNDEAHEVSMPEKIMTWYGIKMKTITDKSNSKIAELMLQGTNMGIIEGRKLLNQKDMDEDIHKLLQEFVEKQEKYVEDLKKYL